MKVGDLVKYKNLHGHVVEGKFISKGWMGIVIETGKYTGNKDVKIMWSETGIDTERSDALVVVNEKT